MTLSSTPEQLQDNNLPNLEAHLQSIVDFFHNGNFKYCVRVANNFISETGFNLTKVRNIYPEESFPSDREIFRSEESVLSFLINYIAENSPQPNEDSIKKASAFLFRRLTRYQVERAECALKTLGALKKSYKTVEKKRRKLGASAISENSLTFLLYQYESAADQFTSIVESISEMCDHYTANTNENVGSLDWSGENFFGEIDVFIESSWKSIKLYSSPIANVEKENREISRVRIAVTALVTALTINTISLFIPEEKRVDIGVRTASFFSSVYNYLTSYPTFSK